MKKLSAYPYVVWSIIFIVFPLILVVLYSVTSQGQGITFTLEHYKRFMEPLYLNIFIHSITLAVIATVICLLLGYPIAMIIAEKEIKKRNVLILLFVLPMWMNFLLRTYAWMSILGKNGFINSALEGLGLPTIKLLYTNGAVILGMVYNFLPFMVLPIYTVLTKMDKNLIEAAKDLGANRFIVFIKIIFPLSLPGVMSGITMVFMPAVSTFVIPKLLGGKKYMLGNVIQDQFMRVGNWNFGSAISIVMMILILISMALMGKYDEKESGGRLW